MASVAFGQGANPEYSQHILMSWDYIQGMGRLSLRDANEIKEKLCIELKLCIVLLKGGDIYIHIYN